MSAIRPGDSIAVSGVCLTAVTLGDREFSADISPETLRCTNLDSLIHGARVNLECALCAGAPLGGHLVSGHVDAIGTIEGIENGGGYLQVNIGAPAEVMRFIARKGSVCVDGVSLTVNAVTDTAFDVQIIPHTREMTVFRDYQVGSQVNIEVDLIARYVERLLATSGD